MNYWFICDRLIFPAHQLGTRENNNGDNDGWARKLDRFVSKNCFNQRDFYRPTVGLAWKYTWKSFFHLKTTKNNHIVNVIFQVFDLKKYCSKKINASMNLIFQIISWKKVHFAHENCSSEFRLKNVYTRFFPYAKLCRIESHSKISKCFLTKFEFLKLPVLWFHKYPNQAEKRRATQNFHQKKQNETPTRIHTDNSHGKWYPKRDDVIQNSVQKSWNPFCPHKNLKFH